MHYLLCHIRCYSQRPRRPYATLRGRLRLEELETRVALSVLIPHSTAAAPLVLSAQASIVQPVQMLILPNLPAPATAPPATAVPAPGQLASDVLAHVLTPPATSLTPPAVVYGKVESGGGDNSLQAAAGLMGGGGTGIPLPAPIPVAPGRNDPKDAPLAPDREASQRAHPGVVNVVFVLDSTEVGPVGGKEHEVLSCAAVQPLLRVEETDPTRETAMALAGLLTALGGYRVLHTEKSGDRRRWAIRR
jgi:hypothetical protein